MRKLAALIAGLALALTVNATALAAINFSQSVVDSTHPLQVFVHTSADGPLGARVTWTKAACCANGHTDSLTLTIALVDQPTADYVEIDANGENCSVAGGKPIQCYVLADPFTKGGVAPAGWYIVKVEQFDDTQSQFNVKASVTGTIDQTVLFPG